MSDWLIEKREREKERKTERKKGKVSVTEFI